MKKMVLFILICVGLYPFVSSIFLIVDERQYAVVFTTGEIRQVIAKPGLYFKKPSPLENAVILEKRTLTSEMVAPEKMTTSEKKFVNVNAFVRWRVTDPKLFYVSFDGSMQRAQDRMLQMTKSSLNESFKHYTMEALLKNDRRKLLDKVKKDMLPEAKSLGISLVDVRIKRLDYLDNEEVFARMKVERVRIASERRANGAAEAEKIRANADKKQTVLIANAKRDAQKIKGDGDAKAARLYAREFGRDPEFAKFYRSLEAYRATFNSRNDVIVVDPSSEFFRYMRNPKASGAK